MSMPLEDARTLVRTLIRSIDKKVDFVVTTSDSERPGVSVALSRDTRHATIVVSQQQLDEVEANSLYVPQLRSVLKRAIDRMTFRPTEFASTKTVRGPSADGGFFRSPQGGPRGGRR